MPRQPITRSLVPTAPGEFGVPATTAVSRGFERPDLEVSGTYDGSVSPSGSRDRHRPGHGAHPGVAHQRLHCPDCRRLCGQPDGARRHVDQGDARRHGFWQRRRGHWYRHRAGGRHRQGADGQWRGPAHRQRHDQCARREAHAAGADGEWICPVRARLLRHGVLLARPAGPQSLDQAAEELHYVRPGHCRRRSRDAFDGAPDAGTAGHGQRPRGRPRPDDSDWRTDRHSDVDRGPAGGRDAEPPVAHRDAPVSWRKSRGIGRE